MADHNPQHEAFLSVGSSGDLVRDLHHRLSLAGFEVLGDEVTAFSFSSHLARHGRWFVGYLDRLQDRSVRFRRGRTRWVRW